LRDPDRVLSLYLGHRVQFRGAPIGQSSVRRGEAFVRILLAGMTNMLFQIVSAVVAQSSESILVGRVDTGEEMASRIRSTQADVLMMQVNDPESGHTVWPLLYRFPTLKVVTIASSGRKGFVHELRPLSRPLAELSAEALHAALHSESVGLPN
jgi:DNA-binding NarL/FixJ family response regulator